MILKIHFLESHLNFFQIISAKSVTITVKDFTKILRLLKSSTQASGPHVFLADYCWTLKSDVPDAKYKRKSSSSTF